MGKLLFFLLIGILVWWLVKGLTKTSKREPPTEPGAAGPEDMVACARCGVNVPHSETRELDGRRVCATNPNCK